MKRLLIILLAMATMGVCAAQNSRNGKADGIVGIYKAEHQGQVSKIKVYKDKNGTYTAMNIWLQDSIDSKTGKLRLDEKNPDKRLRATPCNKIIIFKGMVYNEKKHRWDDGEIYDPTRGLNANCTVEFQADGKLKVRGSKGPFGETVYWTPIK